MITFVVVNFHLNVASKLLKESVDYPWEERKKCVKRALKHMHKSLRYEFATKQQVKQQIKALEKELEYGAKNY